MTSRRSYEARPSFGEKPGGTPPEHGFVRSIFDRLSPRYDAALTAFTFGLDLWWKHELLRKTRGMRAERILDLACGTALILARIQRQAPAARAIGLDRNRSMLRHAPREVQTSVLVQGDAERLPFRSSQFDLVTAGYLVKYVDLDRFVSELRRVLRRDGRFAAYDFSRADPGLSGTAYRLFARRILPVLARGFDGPGGGVSVDLTRYLGEIVDNSAWELRLPERLRRAGFERVELRRSWAGIVTWVWAGPRALGPPESHEGTDPRPNPRNA